MSDQSHEDTLTAAKHTDEFRKRHIDILRAQRDELLSACKYAVAKLPYATAMVAETCRHAIAKVESGE